MSQHFIRCTLDTQPILIQMGWDKPLQGFYLLISREDSCETDEHLYCNLDDPLLGYCMGLPKELDYFIDILRCLGVSVPQTMIDEVKSDRRLNVGNRVVDHGEMQGR